MIKWTHTCTQHYGWMSLLPKDNTDAPLTKIMKDRSLESMSVISHPDMVIKPDGYGKCRHSQFLLFYHKPSQLWTSLWLIVLCLMRLYEECANVALHYRQPCLPSESIEEVGLIMPPPRPSSNVPPEQCNRYDPSDESATASLKERCSTQKARLPEC